MGNGKDFESCGIWWLKVLVASCRFGNKEEISGFLTPKSQDLVAANLGRSPGKSSSQACSRPLQPTASDHHEAWGRLSQVLEDILAQDAYAPVCFYAALCLASLSYLARNLVTSLIQHEQIKTTFPKAQDAARLAEKVRTYSMCIPYSSMM